MGTHERRAGTFTYLRNHQTRLRRSPLTHAIALALAAGGAAGSAHAQQAFSPAWFAAKGAAQGTATATGRLPNGLPASSLTAPEQQSAAARQKLQTSINNLNLAAQAIAAQQALQKAAREAAQASGSSVPDGLGEGGLKVDANSLTAGWLNAKDPVQTASGGQTKVTIEQTADKAILNWETFNVGKETTVAFDQQANWSVLNRVNDPQARPSQIQGRIEAPGTVMIVNRNGIVFSGSSQVNVRNLAAAAAGMTDSQFKKGLYSEGQGSGYIPSFANDLDTTASGNSHGAATGQVVVERGARIATHVPQTVTEGGGYVLLLGGEVHNAGQITTDGGQTVLSAGDAFVIKKGMGTDANQGSTTRGQVVQALSAQEGGAGRVVNRGLIQAKTGDISLVGKEVRQEGVVVSTTSVHTRGTVHLRSGAEHAEGSVVLGEGSVTSILLDESATTALDVQREALVQEKGEITDRRDQSLVQIDSGGTVGFERGSLTLATGGQVYVEAAGGTQVRDGADIDVSGHVGVRIAMEANNVLINVQGFEQRDTPVNRDGDKLRNSEIWLDRRDLVLVRAGTNGYESDRWYTAGGLLEVGGYLGITGHGIGEWSAQGGTVKFSGADVITQRGSRINLSGGTLDVQTGWVNRTWLKGADGNLYAASTAPGDLLYTGLYRGFETDASRWGDAAKESFYNPIIAPLRRLENGYTVGRDGGRLVVATAAATLQGDIETSTYQGDRQVRAREAGLDGYRQAQTAAARRAELIVGNLRPVYDKETRDLRYSPDAVVERVVIGDDGAPDSGIGLEAAWLDGLGLGGLKVYASGGIEVREAVGVAPGGEIGLHATQVDVLADLTARGGSIALGNMVNRQTGANGGWVEAPIASAPPQAYEARTRIGEGVTLDARGMWTNLWQDKTSTGGMPYVDGGQILLASSGDVLLEAGSLVDVSSGATLKADGGTLSGGRGGSVSLHANAYAASGAAAGKLVLEGEIRGHGVKGGGRLSLRSGEAIVIGGQVQGSDGVLREGETSLVDLVTDEAFTIAAGAVLPLDYQYTRTHAAAGEMLGSAPRVEAGNPGSWLTLATTWTPPRATGSSSYTIQTQDGRRIGVYSWATPAPIEAGTVIVAISGASYFPTNWVVPASVFPQGMTVAPSAGVYKAGTVSPVDAVFMPGTVLAAGSRLPQSVAVRTPMHLDADTFQLGFSRYAVQGMGGVAVAEQAAVDVSMPVLRFDSQSGREVASGAEPADALAVWLPDLTLDDPARARLTRRAGASLELLAGERGIGQVASLSIGRGATVRVDPRQTIRLLSNGQVRVDGRLEAHGGAIEVLPAGFRQAGLAQSHARSIWIGSEAVLDVSGQAYVARDANGLRYGFVDDGGRIELGGTYGRDATVAEVTDAFVILRPGAELNASGSAATVDIEGRRDTPLASNGGLIYLGSQNGLYLDGTLRAAAGGAGAVGGTLAVALESPNYANAENPDDAVRALRELHLVREQSAESLPAGLRPGQADAALVYGHGRLGADAIRAGGFDTLSTLVNGVLSLEGGLELDLGLGLRLAAGFIGLREGSEPGAQVRLSAPYVRLAGATRNQLDHHIMPFPQGSLSPGILPGSALTIDGYLIDVIENVRFGTRGSITQASGGSRAVERDAFDHTTLRSQGDLRFLKSLAADRSKLNVPGDLLLAASQVYPATHARAEIWVGQGNAGFDPERSLRIERIGDAQAAVPYSVFGWLTLGAANIEQGGVLRAPLGQISLGGDAVQRLDLLPGSLTSVSAAGLVMPYGGSIDGLTYLYNGVDVAYDGVGSGRVGQVGLAAQRIDVQEGAVLDLSGGGELRGAAFLTGRGGSTDARLNPLVQSARDGFVLPGLATNPVYAIVPGVQAGQAPVAAEAGAGDPLIGRQVVIGQGVPGLPAGTYTLLPSTYALMPGAFRVELNGLAASTAMPGEVSPMRNGSFTAPVRLGYAGTSLIDGLSTPAVLTPADTLRRYSNYNEISYAEFALNWASRDGVPRPLLERDAKILALAPGKGVDGENALEVAAGAVRFAPAKGGYGGSLKLEGERIEILADGQAPTAGAEGTSVHARVLNGIGAPTLGVGALPTARFGLDATQDANMVDFGTSGTGTRAIILRDGAVLKAAQVFLVTGDPRGGITIEQGAGINTLGQGDVSWDSRDGYVFLPRQRSVVAVSNGWLDMLAPAAGDTIFGPGTISIGECAVGAHCAGITQLYSEGTITAATDKAFILSESVRYGTRNLVLAMGGINAGSAQALAAAAAAHTLPPGLTLNQQVLERLLRGDTSLGAPALENLVLTARDAFNFYGDVTLSTLDPATGKSALERLVLGAPALYGHGDAGTVARIETDTLVWNGATTAPQAPVAGGPGTGAGRLVVDAKAIEFGFGPNSRPDTVAGYDRLALGFSTVSLNASERVTANHKGSLSVYQSQGVWDEASKSWTYQGGDLQITTPLLTGAAGSVNALRAGGSIVVVAPQGSTAPLPDAAASTAALGAELSLEAGKNLVLDTAVLLPSGKLALSAQDDVNLASGARLDLAGRQIDFFDVSKYSWGGDVLLSSRHGDVLQHADAGIDVSARFNRAGKVEASALEGTVDLAGQILGGSTGHYDAGGTAVPYASGYVDVRGRHIADFAGLNARLTAGEVFGGRSFQLKEGSLEIGSELKAREINVSVDNGSLRVTGRVDASGEQAGSIRLAANEGVTIAGTAQLDASATVLRRDSYGQVIEAPNRAVIELDSGDGRLVLESGARLDVSVEGAPAAYGTVALNAPRLGGARGRDVAIDAGGTLVIDGAKTLFVNAFQRYDDARVGTDETADGRSYQVVDQAYLDEKHADSVAFIGNALANDALKVRLKGLSSYEDAFHLRPGVEIVSNRAVNPDGDLHVDGDLDLSGHRYASLNRHTQKTGVYGSGEAGALALRAEGDLAVYGSITDGFDTSRLGQTLDDNGWILAAGMLPFGGELIVPEGGRVTLAAGTTFESRHVLNYAVPLTGFTMAAGGVLPVAAPLAQPLTLPAGTVLSGAILDAKGTVLHQAGTVLAEPAILEPGMRLGAGFRMTVDTAVGPVTWPKDVPLPRLLHRASLVTLAADVSLQKGARIPSMTRVVLPDGAPWVDLRAPDADGNHGRAFALAPMLSSGSQSFDLRLVAGADLAAADAWRVNALGTGTLRLADTHYGRGYLRTPIPGTGTPAQYRWSPKVNLEYWTWLGMDIVPGAPIEGEALELFLANGGIDMNQWGSGPLAEITVREIPPDHDLEAESLRQELFSVLRTGTGDLDLLAGKDFAMDSLYGVYTAGAPSAALAQWASRYDLPRGRLSDDSLLSREGLEFEAWIDGGARSLYHAWYPEGGGNVLLRAQGDVKGDVVGSGGGARMYNEPLGDLAAQPDSVSVGNWLWRQGTGSVERDPDLAVLTAWWVNFGTYLPSETTPNQNASAPYVTQPYLIGFTGVGTLGGGNLVVEAGGNAGLIDGRGNAGRDVGRTNVASRPRGQALHLVVGGTGRVTPTGELVQTGGGDLDLRVGGSLNPNPVLRHFDHDLNSTLVNLRGALNVQAGAVGGIQAQYGMRDQMDTRSGDPFEAAVAMSSGGPVLVLGDSLARIQTRGDLVLGGAADPGRTRLLTGPAFSADGVASAYEGWSWFSLWTPATGIDLFSAGGNLTLTTAWMEGIDQEYRRTPAAGRNQSSEYDIVYPSILRATAASGSLYYGVSSAAGYLSRPGGYQQIAVPLTLVPSPLLPQFPKATGNGQLQLLAMDSIRAGGYAISASTADPQALFHPLRPGFSGMTDPFGGEWGGALYANNAGLDSLGWSLSGWASGGGRVSGAGFFTVERGNVSSFLPTARESARYYAVQGDIVGLRAGHIFAQGEGAGSRYEAGGPAEIRAGRDISNSGTPLGKDDPNGQMRGNVFAHAYADDITVVEAGRDIRHSSFYVVGPGLLEVSAGRHVYLADQGEFKSLGPVVNLTPGARNGGASIVVSAGLGKGARWDDFAARYLDPANQADPELPFGDQPGKALTIYSGGLSLAQWLKREFGYGGDEAGAQAFLIQKQEELDAVRTAALAEGRTDAANRSLAREYKVEGGLHLVNWLSELFGGSNGLNLHFDAATMDAREFFAQLPEAQQRAYLRNVYYAELRVGGREYNDPDSRRFGSYLRGREAIATLFPEQDALGNKLTYEGDLTMFSSALYYDQWVNGIPKNRPTPGKTYLPKSEWEAIGSPGYDVAFYDVLDAGIHTNFGGDISIMTPGGRTLVGVDGGFNPGPGSGLLTQGEGDISIYALGSILMGQSRVFTTFGGNILGWSAQGDINAGRGSKTTVVYTPQRRVYDDVGNVALSPQAPSTGAGIATLNPIPEVPPGDIDLIAPLGTIDAGEAGIRVSGNVNLAALRVVNAENIQVQGKSVGIPVVAAVNVAALSNASAAASQAATAAQDVMQRERAASRQALPSIFTVRVLGFGNETVPDGASPRTPAGTPAERTSYDPDSAFKFVGHGALSPGQAAMLTPEERRGLEAGRPALPRS